MQSDKKHDADDIDCEVVEWILISGETIYNIFWKFMSG